MGIDTNLYVGPHITIEKLQLDTSVETEINGCINKDCQEYKKENNGNFCSNCGEEIGIYIEEEIEEKDIYDILYKNTKIDFVDMFCILTEQDGYDVLLLPNTNKILNGNHLDADDEIVFALNDCNPANVIEEFKNDKIVEALLQLLDRYDIEYAIDYSIVQYYT